MATTDDEVSTLTGSGLPAWADAMEKASEDEGYLEPLGLRHWAFFHDDGPKLLVTFESAADIRARPNQMPAGQALAAARGWSALCIIAEGSTWYRDRRVYGYFDRLVDDCFMEDFDEVVFYGAGGMAGYAAAAYSVTAPGATVVVISPRATMDPSLTSWETRDLRARRLNFTDRYGFAPDMTEGAGRVFVLADPHFPPDAMHATLFGRRSYVTGLAMRQTGPETAEMAKATGLVEPLIDAAMAGNLSRTRFASLWRNARRGHNAYIQSLRDRTAAAGLASRAARLDRYAVLRRRGTGEALLSAAPANSDSRPDR